MERTWNHGFVLFISTIVTAYGKDYIGCFENIHLSEKSFRFFEYGLIERTAMESNNGRLCIELCSPFYIYASTQAQNCYCMQYLFGLKVKDEKCNIPCPNQQDRNYTVCGGTLRMSVYEVHPHLHDIFPLTTRSTEIITTHSVNTETPSTKDKISSNVLDSTVTNTSSITTPFTSTEDLTPSSIVADIFTTSTETSTSPAIGSTVKILATNKTTTTMQSTSSDTTNIIIIFSIGTFGVVCLLTIVNLLVLRKRRLNTGRSEQGKDERFYIRPVYATTSPDEPAIPTDAAETRVHIYDCVN